MSEYRMYLNLILETISKLENSFSKTDKENFLEDLELQDATLMRLYTIGENLKKIPFKIKKDNKEIKWRKFEKLRNIISHKYEAVDYGLIWSFIKENLEELKIGISSIK